jgi:hypothetical protein
MVLLPLGGQPALGELIARAHAVGDALHILCDSPAQ